MRIAFDEEVSRSFDNKFARNVAIFSIDNSSSYHTDNRKNIFLVLGKGKDQLVVLIIALVQQKKNNINFSKSNTKFCLSLHYNGDESYLIVNKAGIWRFKAKNSISWHISCLEIAQFV